MKTTINGESIPGKLLKNLKLLAGVRGQLSGSKRGRLRALTWQAYHRRGTKRIPIPESERARYPYRFYNATHKHVPACGSWKFVVDKLKEIDSTEHRDVRMKTKMGCSYCKYSVRGSWRHNECSHAAHKGMEITWGGHPCKFFERGEEE